MISLVQKHIGIIRQRMPVVCLLFGLALTLILLLGCTAVPRTFEDPAGDFSIIYPSDWEEVTAEVAVAYKNQPSVYHIAFAAARTVPDALFSIKKGSDLPLYWGSISSDAAFLSEFLTASIYEEGTETEPRTFSEPVPVYSKEVVGLEWETTFSDDISLRRLFRVRNLVVLEIICLSHRESWASGEKVCRDLMEGVEISTRQ